MALEEKIPGDITSPIENIVRQLTEVDRSSDAFRYPCHRDGSATLESMTHINIKRVSEEIAKASDALEAISAALSVAVEAKADHEVSMRQLYGRDFYT